MIQVNWMFSEKLSSSLLEARLRSLGTGDQKKKKKKIFFLPIFTDDKCCRWGGMQPLFKTLVIEDYSDYFTLSNSG
jgi:hypothetical protein